MKYFYGGLCVVGALLPYALFLPWVAAHGLDLRALIAEATATRIGAFAWLDVVISALTLLTFIFVEGRRQGMKRLWIPALATCTIGVSLGLPLFLLMREHHLERGTS